MIKIWCKKPDLFCIIRKGGGMMDFYKRIAELKAELNYLNRNRGYYQEAQENLKILQNELKSKEDIFQKENEDVDKLNKTSITSLYYKLLGNIDEKIEKERYEAMQASIDYHRVLNDYEVKKDIVEKLHDRYVKEEDLYQELKAIQLEVMGKENPVRKEELLKYIEKYEDIQLLLKEVNEALKAGVQLKEGLENANEQLTKAGNWGLYDIVGGGTISSMIKHNHIDHAQASFQKVRLLFIIFEKELKDVNMSYIGMENMGDTLMAFDCFFDNVFVDIIVQSKIEKGIRNIEDALTKVNKTIARLNLKKEQIVNENHVLDKKIKRIIYR